MKADAAKEKGEKDKKPEPLDPKNYIINIKPREQPAKKEVKKTEESKTDAKKPTVTSTGMGNKY